MTHITMKSYKYDNRLHYESTLNLVEKRENLYILHGPPNRTLTHYTRKKEFVFEMQSIEFFFSDRWYTVACVIDLQGNIKNYYCNIAMPCSLRSDTANFIDLDLDVIIQSDMSYKVIDRDEFEEHKQLLGYPNELVLKAEEALQILINDIETRTFPFDGYIDILIEKLGLKV